MFNPAHIDLFRAVLRHGGMTRAAAALGIGQPYVSRGIAQLEGAVGFPLFVRGHGSASPTPEGEAFAREVELTYAGLDDLAVAARRIREVGTGPLRVACQPSLASGLLPRAIRRLAAERPGIAVALFVPDPDTIWSWAAAGRCDIGLVRPRPGFAGVAAAPFSTVDAVCALPRRHPLAGRRSIALGHLDGVPLIAGAPGAFQRAVEEAFAAAGLVPRFVHTAQYTAARCGLVGEGLGAAIVDPVAARQVAGPDVALRPLRAAIPIETVLVRPAGRPASVPADRLVAILEAERDAGPGEGEPETTGRPHLGRDGVGAFGPP